MIKTDLNTRVAVFTGVGEPDYVCGASRSVFMIFKRINIPFVAVMEGPGGITQEYTQAGTETVVLRSPATTVKGFRRFSILNKINFLLSVICYFWHVWWFLMSRRIDIVYVTNMTSYFVVLPARLCGCKTIVAIRGSLKKSLKTWFLLRFSHRFLLLSKEEMENVKIWYKRLGIKVLERKLSVIYNGTEICDPCGRTDSVKADEELPIADKVVSILYVAAFRRAKNQKEFIDLVIPEILKKAAGRVEFTFLGGATCEDDLRYLRECQEIVVSRKQSSSVKFVDYTERIDDWYTRADIVVLASKNEGMPRCVVESLAHGRPVVCYNVSSVQEIVAIPQTGFVVSQGDALAMAEKLLLLIENDAKRLEMGRRAREFARKNLDIDIVATQHESLLKSML